MVTVLHQSSQSSARCFHFCPVCVSALQLVPEPFATGPASMQCKAMLDSALNDSALIDSALNDSALIDYALNDSALIDYALNDSALNAEHVRAVTCGATANQ